jgi:succinate dehydrogenase / fumarate reductase cytochrome b subunit
MDDDNHLLADTLNARTMSLAEEQGVDIMTICGTCQGVMRTAQQKMDRDPKYKDKINAHLKKDTGRVYQGKVKIKHFYQVIHENYGLENLAARVTNKLTGLKVAPFYGCYVLRPHEYSDTKTPDRPDYLEKMISIVGATAVDYPEKLKCCGFPILMPNKTNSLQLSGNAIVGAIKAGADCIVTPCPLCHLNMDSYQPEIESMLERKLSLPILHYPQLLSLALGATLDDIKAFTHIVRPNQALHEVVD